MFVSLLLILGEGLGMRAFGLSERGALEVRSNLEHWNEGKAVISQGCLQPRSIDSTLPPSAAPHTRGVHLTARVREVGG